LQNVQRSNSTQAPTEIPATTKKVTKQKTKQEKDGKRNVDNEMKVTTHVNSPLQIDLVKLVAPRMRFHTMTNGSSKCWLNSTFQVWMFVKELRDFMDRQPFLSMVSNKYVAGLISRDGSFDEARDLLSDRLNAGPQYNDISKAESLLFHEADGPSSAVEVSVGKCSSCKHTSEHSLVTNQMVCSTKHLGSLDDLSPKHTTRCPNCGHGESKTYDMTYSSLSVVLLPVFLLTVVICYDLIRNHA